MLCNLSIFLSSLSRATGLYVWLWTYLLPPRPPFLPLPPIRVVSRCGVAKSVGWIMSVGSMLVRLRMTGVEARCVVCDQGITDWDHHTLRLWLRSENPIEVVNVLGSYWVAFRLPACSCLRESSAKVISTIAHSYQTLTFSWLTFSLFIKFRP